MQPDLQVLLLTAITISFLHTVSGPDHYIPFIALSKSRGWSIGRTIFWTFICGSGHILSSVLLGLGGAAVGWSLAKLNIIEGVRGGLAGWMLLGFGLFYSIWGILLVKKNKQHKHFDVYNDGSIYVYEHKHGEVVAPKDRHRVTPWVMFLIFVLGPCEPMIPLLYFPAAQSEWWNMLLLIIIYTVFTLVTMFVLVVAGFYGFGFFKTEKLEKYIHPLSGLTIFICGLGMVFMGW